MSGQRRFYDAVERERRWRTRENGSRGLGFAVLTPREMQVLEAVVALGSSKRAAYHLGLSPRTIEIHRERICSAFGTIYQAIYRLGQRDAMQARAAWDAGAVWHDDIEEFHAENVEVTVS